MRMKRWLYALILLLLCNTFVASADNGEFLDVLTEHYGEPVLMSENIDVYDDGITICFFPGEGIVILYKSSEDAKQLNAWEIVGSDAIDKYVTNALNCEAIKTVYIDFSDMSAKQYPEDFTSTAVPDAERYSEYDTFLKAISSNASNEYGETIAAETTSWSSWSDWSTTAVEANSSTEVEKKTQYRSRDIYINQDYTSWSGWSEWSTAAVSESSTRDVETKTEYRYRDTTTQTQYSDWGSWSDWSTTATSETTLRDVETKTEEKVTYTYTYRHWHYKHSENGWQNSYAEYKGSKYVEGSGTWEYKTTTSPLPQDGTKDGHARYRSGGVSWYYQTIKENVETITYYRYRTRTEQQVSVTGSWSNWSSTGATATSTREVQTRSLYRYRTREVEAKTTYGKWSAWSDSWIGENSERDVETRTVYRYRKIE